MLSKAVLNPLDETLTIFIFWSTKVIAGIPVGLINECNSLSESQRMGIVSSG